MVVRVSNALHLEVLSNPPTVRTGIVLEVYDGQELATMLAVLTDAARDIKFTTALNPDLDVLSFVVNRNHPKAATVVRGNMVKARYNGVYAGGFLIESDPTTELSEDGKGDEDIRITARGNFAYADEAVMDDVSLVPGGEDPIEGVWNLTLAGGGNGKGQIARRLIHEAQSHSPPWLPDVTVDFSYTVDSQGNPWDDGVDMDMSVGALVGDGLRKLIAMGLEMQVRHDLRFQAFKEFGRHFEATVVFGGGNVIRRERPAGTAALKSRLLVLGKNNLVVDVIDPVIEANLGRPVVGSLRFDSDDPTTLDEVGKAALEQLKSEKEALVLPVRRGDGPGEYEPYIDYRHGDWIGYRRSSAAAPESRRILAITVSQADQTSTPQVELELDAIVFTPGQRQRRQIDTISGNVGVVGGSADLRAASPAPTDAASLSGTYQRRSEKGQANGYAPLSSGILVPVQYLGSGTPDATKFLRGDGAWAVPPGAGGSGAIKYPALKPPIPTYDFTDAALPGAFVARSGAGAFDLAHVMTQGIDWAGSAVELQFSEQFGAIYVPHANTDFDFSVGGIYKHGMPSVMMFGIAALNASGTGVGVVVYNDNNAYFATITAWQYTAFSATAANRGHNIANSAPWWLRLSRAANTWTGRISQSGRAWDLTFPTRADVIVVDRLVFGLFYNNPTPYSGRLTADYVHVSM